MRVTQFEPNNFDQFLTSKKAQETFADFTTSKLPFYVTQHSSKIKPVHGNYSHIYELKLHLNDQHYRLAYYFLGDTITLCYLSATLQKVKFDREVNRFLKQANYENDD